MDELEQRWVAANWKAWHSRMPAQPPILYVRGLCEFPSTGYRVELRRSLSQGADPAILVLDLVISETSEPVSVATAKKEARYEEKTHQRYGQVQIRPCNIVVTVEEAS
jgi:hypothetical protein